MLTIVKDRFFKTIVYVVVCVMITGDNKFCTKLNHSRNPAKMEFSRLTEGYKYTYMKL